MPNSIDLLTNTTGLAIADKLERQNAILAAIASNNGGLAVDSWSDVSRVARMGLADKVFAVGDQLSCLRGEDTLTWDIVNLTPTEITLLLHDALMPLEFSANQALYYAESGLTAGDYYFSDGTTTYGFTLTTDVPSGGQVVISGGRSAALADLKVSTYASGTAAEAIESNIALTAGSTTGTELTQLNDIARARQGSGNYRDSAIRQWLNSSASAGSVWTSKTVYDRPPMWASTEAGFLNGLDADFVNVVAESTVKTINNIGNEGGGYYETEDKFFLPSTTEVYAGNFNGIAEGTVFDMYKALAPNAAMTGIPGRAKYISGAAVWWYLRTPYHPSTEKVRGVVATGNVETLWTTNTVALCMVVPCCKIS